MNNYAFMSQQMKEEDLLVMGDLNAYAYEDPIRTFTTRGMRDLHRHFHADSSYSYTFSSQAGYLDHAIASSTLLPQITGMTAFHVNSDESDYYTYDSSNDETMFRYSDHDPVLVGLRLDKSRSKVPSLEVDNYDVLVNASDITISNALGAKADAFYVLTRVDGVVLQRENITAERTTIPKPEAAGLYILSVYCGNRHISQQKILVTK